MNTNCGLLLLGVFHYLHKSFWCDLQLEFLQRLSLQLPWNVHTRVFHHTRDVCAVSFLIISECLPAYWTVKNSDPTWDLRILEASVGFQITMPIIILRPFEAAISMVHWPLRSTGTAWATLIAPDLEAAKPGCFGSIAMNDIHITCHICSSQTWHLVWHFHC